MVSLSNHINLNVPFILHHTKMHRNNVYAFIVALPEINEANAGS